MKKKVHPFFNAKVYTSVHNEYMYEKTQIWSLPGLKGSKCLIFDSRILSYEEELMADSSWKVSRSHIIIPPPSSQPPPPLNVGGSPATLVCFIHL